MKQLREDVKIQDTMNKAYHVISYGNILRLKPTFRDIPKTNIAQRITITQNLSSVYINEDNFTEICAHSICQGQGCNGKKLSQSIEDELINIVQKRNPTYSNFNIN